MHQDYQLCQRYHSNRKATSKAKEAIESQGMRADGIEISEIAIEKDVVDKVEEQNKRLQRL